MRRLKTVITTENLAKIEYTRFVNGYLEPKRYPKDKERILLDSGPMREYRTLSVGPDGKIKGPVQIGDTLYFHLFIDSTNYELVLQVRSSDNPRFGVFVKVSEELVKDNNQWSRAGSSKFYEKIT